MTGPGGETRIPYIVAVNDDPTQLHILVGLLKSEGMRVGSFTDAATALADMDREGPPDLIVTDLYMPDLDGWRFCRLLRSPEHGPLNSVPVLVISATFSGDEAARITADLGANAFMPSPVNGERFIERVRTLLEGEQPRHFLHCLIIEDDEAEARRLETAFETHGYQGDIAHSVGAARKMFQNAPYDVAVIAYDLPDGPGDALLEEFETVRPDCARIMMTRDAHSHLAVEWMKRGAAAYLRKPFDPEYLIELCDRARRERALLRVEDLLEERTRKLRESEERYRLLVEKSNDIIWTYDLSSKSYSFVSDSVEHILGYPAGTDSGKGLVHIFTEETKKKVQAAFGKVAAGEVPDDRVLIEAEHRHRDGRMVWLEINATLLRDKMGRPAAFSGVSRDITQRKQAEAERLACERRLYEIRKAQSLGRMAGAVAHNFNNLLGAVIGNLEMSLEDLDPESSVRDMLNAALTASGKAAEISRAMLAYRGQIAGKRKPADLARLCADTLPLLRASQPVHVDIRAELSPAGPIIEADPVQIRQILTHLVENAGEAMGETPGEIRISVQTIDSEEFLAFRCFPPDWVPEKGPYACLEVADTGRGMDDSEIDQLFDPYFTTKFTGRGLGLAVVLGTVAAYGGGIAVESGPGEGSVFRVLFPVSAVPLSRSEGDGRDVSVPFMGGGTLLLVEDDAFVRKMGEAMISRMGFRVLTAKDGKDAVAVFREHGEQIRCVICDLTMPRMNGWETIEALRALRPGLPVILASGYDEAHILACDHEEMPQAFLLKPFRRSDLRKTLGRVLDESEPGDSVKA